MMTRPTFTRRQRWSFWWRTRLNRVAWLWRRPAGCVCDPDGYSLGDRPKPICGRHTFEGFPPGENWLLDRLNELGTDVCDTLRAR